MTLGLLLYHIFLWFYRIGIFLSKPFNQKANLFYNGRKGLLQRIKADLSSEKRPIIWLHCASLGEFEQGRPVLETLKKSFPEKAFLVTFFSPSGYEVRKNYDQADYVFYLPMDSAQNAQRFLDIAQPQLILFVKYEFWYHYLFQAHQRGIPLVLFSAFFKPNQIFFRSYGKLYRQMLTFFKQIFVQDRASQNLLQKININSVQIAGDTRFDRMETVIKEKKDFPFVQKFCQDKKILVAGSTWPKDEVLIEKAFRELKDSGYKLIVAPHEIRPDRLNQLKQLFASYNCAYFSQKQNPEESEVLIIDAVGYLSQIYQYADVAWIGGGFDKGIHNVVEPAAYGIPVFIGPNFHRFREAEMLVNLGGIHAITTAEQLIQKLNNPVGLATSSEKIREYVATQTGATQRIVQYICQLPSFEEHTSDH